MNLSSFCIKRPAFTIVLSLTLIIIGLMSFLNLPVRWIPNISPPEVTIETTFPGANAKLVEHDVTKVIEDGLSGINGVEMLTSKSRQGISQIDLQFKLGRNMDAAVEDVRGSIERIRDMLPKDVDNPIVTKANPDSRPILYIGFRDPTRQSRELGDYIERYVKSSFETIDGVGTVWIYGRKVSAIQVSLDPQKMAAANVTADEVAQLLHEQNASIPSGQIKGLDRYYSVVTDTQLKSAEDFNRLVIRNKNNQIIRLSDIGQAKLDIENADSSFRINGTPGIALGIVPQSTANPLDVEKAVQQKFKELTRSLPSGMTANIIFNQADYIRDSINHVYKAFFEAMICVWLVILIFLGTFRATIIPVITIPVCIMSTFTILYLFNFTINTLTLMALVLAIGLVVDDAIVMLENISHYLEKGLSPFQAAIKGSGEMIFPIIAMTLTLAAVYAPIAFTPGLMGVLFREFTFTLAGAVIISGFVALTLTPMMCGKLLSKYSVSSERLASSKVRKRWVLDFSGMTRYVAAITRSFNFEKCQKKYNGLLQNIMRRRHWIAVLLFGLAVIGGGFYYFIPKELAPAENMNVVFVSISAPRDASFTYTDKYAREMEKIYATIPDINAYFSMAGMGTASHAFQLVILHPNNRQFSTEEIIGKLSLYADQITGARINVFMPPPALSSVTGNDDGSRVGVVLMTSADYRNLQQVSKQILDSLKENPVFAHVRNSLNWDSDQLQVSIDRNKAADLRVPIHNITNTLSTLIAGKKIGKVDEMNVLLRMDEASLANPAIIPQLYVRNEMGNMVSLNGLLSVNQSSTSENFQHYERLRADTIHLTLMPNHNIADGILTVENTIKPYLSNNIKYSFTGDAKNFLESNGKMAITFMLALVFIYLVLVAQFESFIDPFIILLTVPFAIVGAFMTLKLFSGTLNIYSNIGLITLIGLIAKHGILIVDFANRLREKGLSVADAVIEAANRRLRPILMTTAAMVLGALPLAFASGPGSESRQQVGLVIVGGLLFGTFFSLIVVPIVYTYFAPLKTMKVMDESDSVTDTTI